MFFSKQEPQPQQVATRSGRRPGQSAREKQKELADAAPIKTFFARLFNFKTDEWSWRMGAEGEERVGAILEQLRPLGWHIEHDVRVGRRGANLDHLVIGPPGVFVLNTKKLSGSVRVDGAEIRVARRRRNYVEELEAEAQRTRQCLLGATGRQKLWVQGLLVLANRKPKVQQQPRNVEVLHHSGLVKNLQARPARLERSEMEALVEAARREDTWSEL
ncbi:nuclease-related domain-containing protein [Pyxidicoccus sp. 3LFB2]